MYVQGLSASNLRNLDVVFIPLVNLSPYKNVQLTSKVEGGLACRSEETPAWKDCLRQWPGKRTQVQADLSPLVLCLY